MADFNVNKRSAGVFLTQGDPFGYEAVYEWVRLAVEEHKSTIIMEPYAGRNSLLASFNEHFADYIGENVTWKSYDITPPAEEDNLFPQSPVVQANTLISIPDTADIIVTNPPYLARNSARRRGLDFPFNYAGTGIENPADLYQVALDTCLATAGYCAMLIPESFITSRYDKKRLFSVISLPGNLFSDTECPVCLALFIPQETDDFSIYNATGKLLGTYKEFLKKTDEMLGQKNEKIHFNIPNGEISLHGVDNTVDASIFFGEGSEIDSSAIKVSSRALTRIHIDDFPIEKKQKLIDDSNVLLAKWRLETNDIFLTAFKGERKDGKYRRRLSFDYAERIIDKCLLIV